VQLLKKSRLACQQQHTREKINNNNTTTDRHQQTCRQQQQQPTTTNRQPEGLRGPMEGLHMKFHDLWTSRYGDTGGSDIGIMADVNSNSNSNPNQQHTYPVLGWLPYPEPTVDVYWILCRIVWESIWGLVSGYRYRSAIVPW
jgi:hypothetical protein